MAHTRAKISPMLMFVRSLGSMQSRKRPRSPMKMDTHVSTAIFFLRNITEMSGTKNI